MFNNEDLNHVTWQQRVMLGSPKFDETQVIPNIGYAKFAELIGLRGIYVDDPEVLGAASDASMASDTPCVIEVKTDPEVPPLPPHISFDQAKTFMATLGKGDSSQGHMLVETTRQALSSVLPGSD